MVGSCHDRGPGDCHVAAAGTGYGRRHLVERRGAVQRLLRIEGASEAGSYTIEGIVAIGVFFLLLMLIVQLGFLVLARNIAATSVDAALRKAVSADLGEETVRDGLERDVRAVVPGAADVSVDVSREPTAIHAVVQFRWIPPGPDFMPVTISINRTVVRVVPP